MIDTFLSESLAEGWYDPTGRAASGAGSGSRPAAMAKA
jgi:hypothetical protein